MTPHPVRKEDTMPYKGETIEGHDNVVAEVHRFNSWLCNAPAQTVVKAVRIEYEHSSFEDPGKDWNKAHFYDKDGALLWTVHQYGY